QALPLTGADKLAVPVGIDSEKGGEVTFSAVTIPIGNNRFWLEDRLTGIFTELGTKSYTVTIPEKTYGTGRFFILASANTPTGVRPDDAEDPGIRIWTSHRKVIIKGEVGSDAYCELYNLDGKKMMKRLLADDELNTVELPAG